MTRSDIAESLSRLIGMSITACRDAGNMKNFQFGKLRPHPSGAGTVGQFALHIQCPWRLLGGEGIVTGSDDYYLSADPDSEVDLKDSQAGNLQRKRLNELFEEYGTEHLCVEEISADDFGGLELRLSGSFRLHVIPCGSKAEDWRFFSSPAAVKNISL